MAVLEKYQKEFVVKQLAMFETPSAVCELVKEEYDIEIDRRQVCYYNPNTKQGNRELAQKWRHLFEQTRDKFLEGTIEIPIANKQYRLNQLQRNYTTLLRRGEIAAANQVLEQAAKEMGGAYGAPIEVNATQNNFYQQVNAKITQTNQKK